MKFNPPDSATATLGLSAPVATEVVMAFAESWKPLVKSNPSAVITAPSTMSLAATASSVELAGPAQQVQRGLTLG